MDPSADGAKERRPWGLSEKRRILATRASGAWVSTIVAALLVVVMLIFIGQNTRKVELKFLGFDGRFPLGLVLLFSAVSGVFLVAVPGTVRIVELRHALRRNRPRGSQQESADDR